MNKGVALANGTWINFMNSGDLFFNRDVIKSLISYFFKADMVYGNHAIYETVPASFSIVDAKQKKSNDIPYCHQALFEKKEYLIKYPFDLNYKISSDYDHYLKCKNDNINICFVPILVVKFLDGGLSSIDTKRLLKDNFNVAKKYFKYCAIYTYLKRLLKFYVTKALK